MHDDNRFPFQKLEIYGVARETVKVTMASRIRDAELRDQATRAAKSAFCNLSEGLPLDSVAMRRKYFATADGSLHELVAAVDCARALEAVDASHAAAVQALGLRFRAMLRGLRR